jgi:hypothetical protein
VPPADVLSWTVMNENRQRGGRAHHSVLEPHFEFIRELRQRRKTWQEIADLLFTEKGIRVTLHAPYLFYRRNLKRAARPHWEKSSIDSEPARPNSAASRPHLRPAPLPAEPAFKRPDIKQLSSEEFA